MKQLKRTLTFLVIFSTFMLSVCKASDAPVIQAPKFAYVTNFSDKSISMYSFAEDTGLLTPLPKSTIAIERYYPNDLQIAPTGKYLYSVNNDDGWSFIGGSITQYSIDAITGQLSLIQTVELSSSDIQSMVFNQSGQFAYVIDAKGFVYMYKVNTKNGALTRLNPFFVNVPVSSMYSKLSPSGKYLYVCAQFAQNGCSVFGVDNSTGQLSPIGTPVTTAQNLLWGMTISPDGQYLYTSQDRRGDENITTYKINADGTIDPNVIVTHLSDGLMIPGAPTLSPSGHYLYLNNGNTDIFSVNNGVLTSIGTIQPPGALFPWGLIFSPKGNYAFVLNHGTSSISAYSFSETTGILSPMVTPTISTGPYPNAMVFSK